MRSRSRRSLLLVAAFLAIVAVGAGLRFWALDFGLPHLMTRPDEEVILVETKAPASGNFDFGYGVYPTAYVVLTWLWGAVGLNLLQLLGAAPPGSYLQVIDASPADVLLLERSLSGVAGVLAVVLLAYFARRELGTCAGLLAAAFLATCFLHVRDSHSAKPDVLMSLGVVAALGCMAPLARAAETGRAVATGVVIGLAMGTKYPAVLLCVPLWVACFAGTKGTIVQRLVPRAAIFGGIAAAVTFVVTSPDLLLNPATRSKVLGFVPLVFPQWFPEVAPGGPAPGAVDVAPVGEGDGFAYYAGFALRYGIGLPALVLLPFATLWGFFSGNGLPLVAAVFAVVSYVVLSASPALLSRYMTPVTPAIAILLAGAVVAALRRFVPERGLAVTLAVAALVLVAEPLARSVAHDRIASREDTRVLASRWLEEHVPPDARVAVAGTVFWGWGEPWIPPPREMVRTRLDAAEIDASGASFLLTHDHVLFASRVDPAALAALSGRLELRAEFEPFVAARDEARFDLQDAFYIPMAGFGAVERPGPQVRIYAWRKP
ncbi:MAG: glycosyltransferase family 39 protein [Deltaproteobacteria bacterium]|nr:glycosyltransferase family 39 protein [Deltaproteobacteria bacterium]